MSTRLMNVGFVLFPQVTQFDVTGPWEVLTRVPGASCFLVAADLAPVRSASGLVLTPNTSFEKSPPLDILCVPGGSGHLRAMEDAALLTYVCRQAETCRYVTSVCTGSMVLAAAGLLRGYRATTHWMSLDRLSRFGAIPVSERVVVDRNRITGGGVTAGIDFALTLAAALGGETLARSIALQMEYAPALAFSAGHPGLADPALVASVRARGSADYVKRMMEVDARAAARLDHNDAAASALA